MSRWPVIRHAMPLSLALLAVLLFTACCTTRGPAPDRNTPPMLTVPADPAELANYLLTAVLTQSPLRDFSRQHRIHWDLGNVTSNPVADATAQELQRRLLLEDHLRLLPGTSTAEWHLALRVTPALAATPPTLTLELSKTTSPTLLWQTTQPLTLP